MDKIKNFSLKNFLTVFAILLLTLSLAFSCVACDNSDDSSSSSSSSSSSEETATDYQTILNGDFEFNTDEDTSFPVKGSSVKWTQSYDSLSTYATTSSYSSGIIDTTSDAYNEIAEDNNFPKVDETNYFNPHTPGYYGLIENYYDEANEDSQGLPTNGNKVLMIHNELKSYPNRGTAQKFTSTSSISLSNGEYGKVSVWVLTNALATESDQKDYGAYISITNTMSSTRAPLIVKGINTNGNWVNYTFYLEGSDYQTSTFKIVLGLGFGSSNLKYHYCEGYAYFDNINYQEIDKDEYDNAKSCTYLNIFNADGTEKDSDELIVTATNANIVDNGDASTTYDGAKVTTYNYALSNSITNTAYNIPSVEELTINDIYVNKAQLSYTYGDGCLGGLCKYNALPTAITETSPFGDVDTIYLYHPQNKGASSTLKTGNISLDAGKYLHISFYAKIKTGTAQTGATINVNEMSGSEELSSKAIASSLTTIGYDNEATDDWERVNILIHNSTESTCQYQLEFIFGTESAVTDQFALTEGYALFTNFNYKELVEDEYNIASFSDVYGSVTLTGEKLNQPDDEEEEDGDAYTFSYTAAFEPTISTNVASSIVNYTGVVQNHSMVGGTKTAFKSEDVTAGLINTKYIDAYDFLTEDEKAGIKELAKEDDNEYLQPMIIKSNNSGYGYIGSSNTISVSSTTLITVKVKVFDNAKAYIYLVNANQLEGFNILNLSANQYTVDANGKPTEDEETKIVNQDIYAVVDNTTKTNEDGWVEVNFLIKSGINEINYRIELWNGSRDGNEQSTGLVVFDQITTSSSPNEAELIAKARLLGEATKTIKYTRMPTTVTRTDDNGDEYTTYSKYNETEVYVEYSDAKTIIADFSTIDVEHTEDKTTSDDSSSSDDDDDDDETSYSAVLQITSILITAALLIALVVILIRQFTKSKRASNKTSETYYNRDSRERANNDIEANKAKRDKATQKIADEIAEVPEYDYDNMENNIEPENAEAVEQAEEVTEVSEVVEETNDTQNVEEVVEPTENAQTEETVVEESNKEQE